MMFGGLLCHRETDNPQGWIEPEHLLAKLDPYAVSDKRGFHCEGPALLAQALRWNTPHSRHATPPVRCATTGRTVAGWIRLDNRDALCCQLGLANNARLTDEAIILASYHRWGRKAAPRLEGEFSFAIHDCAEKSLWCVRDVVGTRPFFYTRSDDWFAFASTAAAFTAIKRYHPAPSEAWIARYLLGYSHDHRRTALEGVLRIPPAHEMLVLPGKVPEPRRYFSFDDPEPGVGVPDESWVARYRQDLQLAVAQSTRSDYPVAAELSGGVDSSALVASAAQVPASTRLHTLGLAMFEQDADAQHAVAEHCGIDDHVTLAASLQSWLDEAHERAHAMLGFPLEHANAGMHLPLYQEASQRGVRTLLSGFGGDEIVSSGGRELYREAIDAGRYGTLWRAVGSTTRNRVRGTAQALKDRFASQSSESKTVEALLNQLDATPLDPDLRKALALDDFQRERGTFFYGNTPNQTVLGRAFRAYVAGRFESCSAIAASYGIEYRWPLMNRTLIETFLATPSIEKHRYGIGRYLHRRAIDGLVPRSIAWHAKSMGPVRAELQQEDHGQLLRNIDLLPTRLVSILSIDKYRELGESLKKGSDAKAGFDRHGAYERDLARRIGKVADWLSTFEV